MHFPVDTVTAEIPQLLNRFIAITGVAPWQQRERDFTRQIKDNPLMVSYLDEQFRIERSMLSTRQHLKNTGRIPPILGVSTGIGELYAFCGTIARAFSRLPPSAQGALRQKLNGALKDNVGLAPLAFEMRAVAHFMAKGLDLDFHDLCGAGGYDFLTRNSQIEIEVECKSVSGNLGRRVHLLRQYQLGPHILQSMRDGAKHGVIQLIVATLPDRLHGQHEFIAAVGARISEAIMGGNDLGKR